MNKICICIPTYKNRFSDLLSNVKNLDRTKYDIKIFLSENDYIESNYDKYDWDYKNIETIITPCKSIYEKRQYMLDYVIEKYDYMWQLDDDVSFLGKKITAETKRTTSNSYKKLNIEFSELLSKVEETLFYNQDAVLCSPTHEFALGLAGVPGKINWKSRIQFGQIIFLDLSKVREAGCKYDTTGTTHEDVDFGLQLIQYGYKCLTLDDYGYVPGKASIKKSTTCNLADMSKFRVSLYLKYRDGITLTVTKKGLISMRMRLDKYYKTTEIPVINDDYHNYLYELCKTYDIEKIKYIITHKNEYSNIKG